MYRLPLSPVVVPEKPGTMDQVPAWKRHKVELKKWNCEPSVNSLPEVVLPGRSPDPVTTPPASVAQCAVRYEKGPVHDIHTTIVVAPAVATCAESTCRRVMPETRTGMP